MIFNKILKSNSGVAIIMILTTITLLTAMLVDFTFNTNINKIKVYNIQDHAQAQLNAESGLQLALARLRLYQEAFNLFKKNQDAQKFIKIEDLNQIWSLPFIYPIPKSDQMNLIQKATVDEFMKSVLLQGEMSVEIQNASNKINLNLLRLSPLLKNNSQNQTDDNNNDSNEVDAEFKVETQLKKLIQDLFEKKSDSDDRDFIDKQLNKDPEKLVAAIGHYVSDKDSFNSAFITELEGAYTQKGTTPKYAPMSSISEVLLIDGWDNQLLDELKGSLTVHGSASIDLNKITQDTLKILIPNLEKEQIEQFFKYRDDPEDPHYFNDVKSFRQYIVETANFISANDFDDRMSKFSKAGLKFGVTGNVFQVYSKGRYNRAEVNISAQISLPAMPQPTPTPTATSNSDDEDNETTTQISSTPVAATPTPSPSVSPSPTPEIQLYQPRVVEMEYL